MLFVFLHSLFACLPRFQHVVLIHSWKHHTHGVDITVDDRVSSVVSSKLLPNTHRQCSETLDSFTALSCFLFVRFDSGLSKRPQCQLHGGQVAQRRGFLCCPGICKGMDKQDLVDQPRHQDLLVRQKQCCWHSTMPQQGKRMCMLVLRSWEAITSDHAQQPCTLCRKDFSHVPTPRTQCYCRQSSRPTTRKYLVSVHLKLSS